MLKLQTIPKKPGVYIFKDSSNNIIYIGKAKNLKNRVSSYFKSKNSLKIDLLINEYNDIEYILTSNENEALLLEAQLIKKFQPKYNVLLKDGNPFIYIVKKYDNNLKLYKLELSLFKTQDEYFWGPFINKAKVRSFYEYIIREFKLFICNKNIKNGCLDFHINRCAGTCNQLFDINEYNKRLDIAIDLLDNNYEKARLNILNNIEKYNHFLEFEKSQKLVKYLNNLDDIITFLKLKFNDIKYIKDIEKLDINIVNNFNNIEALNILSKIFNRNINTIDCIDISHFQSRFIVGSVVRFDNGIFDLKNSRRYRLKNIVIQDDYRSIKEVIIKRYKSEFDLPSLILIDGGKGQLNSAIEQLSYSFKNFLCISLAKQEECLFLDNSRNIKLNLKDSYARLLTYIRDAAHNFAISYHKYIRDQNFLK